MEAIRSVIFCCVVLTEGSSAALLGCSAPYLQETGCETDLNHSTGVYSSAQHPTHLCRLDSRPYISHVFCRPAFLPTSLFGLVAIIIDLFSSDDRGHF